MKTETLQQNLKGLEFLPHEWRNGKGAEYWVEAGVSTPDKVSGAARTGGKTVRIGRISW